MWKPKVGEKHRMILFYWIRITFIFFTSTNWKEAPTPFIYQCQLDRITNSLNHRNQLVVRISILSGLQLTLEPPFHPRIQASTYMFLRTHLKDTSVSFPCTTLPSLSASSTINLYPQDWFYCSCTFTTLCALTIHYLTILLSSLPTISTFLYSIYMFFPCIHT